jgi:reactive intermediate/imine deaminase
MSRTYFSTEKAPKAIGTYSQSVSVSAGQTLYLSGQIGLDPETMVLQEGFEAQAIQMFENLKAVTEASGAVLSNAVKLTLYLTDLSHFGQLNDIMSRYFDEPYPARAAVGVRELPRGALVEADAIIVLDR